MMISSLGQNVKERFFQEGGHLTFTRDEMQSLLQEEGLSQATAEQILDRSDQYSKTADQHFKSYDHLNSFYIEPKDRNCCGVLKTIGKMCARILSIKDERTLQAEAKHKLAFQSVQKAHKLFMTALERCYDDKRKISDAYHYKMRFEEKKS